MAVRIRRPVVLLGAAVVCALAVAACSSSGSGASDAASAGGGGSASTIVVGGTAPFSSPVYSIPQARATLQAGVDSVNAAGGVSGHRLKLEFCDTQFQA